MISVGAMDRTKYIGGKQSKRVKWLNEGLVRHLYNERNMTVKEISELLNCQPVSVLKFMDKCGIPRRVAAKRDQQGERNTNWSGEKITYKAAHARVYRLRGSPKHCEHCQSVDSSKKYEWANVSGKYHDPNDYIRLCRSCHCKYDNLIRNLGEHANVANNIT
ncbi:hypothetical protein ACP26C_13850 [Franconibacter helveticus 513]|uniref:hypothetical protein n=1 Tax=Franconibacter helveticus TaxID=357240 RepID=UPI0008FEF87D|nr:hypothetical protein [Franconibacter helveticus]